MSRGVRLILFGVGAIGLVWLLLSVFVQLPAPGNLRDRYLTRVDERTYLERNITCVVTAINFDYRGIDTLGEEFILFTSIMGVLVLLRQAEDEPKLLPDTTERGRDVGPSDAWKLLTLGLAGVTLLFGIYVVLHGQLTPGGGFQGGAIIASAMLLIYLCNGLKAFKEIVSHEIVEHAEAVGIGGFLLVGLLALIAHQPFLTNIIPLGETNELTSGGTIAWISAATGVEVAAGFTLLLHAFLQTVLTTDEKE